MYRLQFLPLTRLRLCTFQPWISPGTKATLRENEFQQAMRNWDLNRKQKIVSSRKMREENAMGACTFAPATSGVRIMG
jgi:hypothetical protein